MAWGGICVTIGAATQAAIWRRMRHDTTLCACDTTRGARGRGLESRYKNCIVIGLEGSSSTTRRARARSYTTTIRSGVRCDMAGCTLRHGRACVATRRSARVMCAQAGLRVGALCTRLSFDSVHCSESLFRTLFMNIVNEHCSRGLNFFLNKIK